MAVTRYSIVSIWVQKPGEIISFQHKIPAYLTFCSGFKLSLLSELDSAHMDTEVGRLSASFNSLKEEAITTSLKFEELGSQDFQQLEVQLRAGQIVSGVYVDTLLSEDFSPYKVNLYLRCTDREVQTTNTKAQCTTT
jgi:hypothetical protein